MKKALLAAAFVLLVCFGDMDWAFAVDLNGTPIVSPTADGERIFSTTGNVSAQSGTVTIIGGPLGTIIGGDGAGFATSIGRVEQKAADPDAILNINAPNTGSIKLTITTLALDKGGDFTINLGDSASTANVNELIISNLAASAANADTFFTVGRDSRLTIQNIDNNKLGGAHAIDLTLSGGQAVVANGVTLANGKIAAAGGLASTFAVGESGLIVNGAGAVLSATGASTILNILTTTDSGNYADVAVGGSGGIIEIHGDAVMNLGDLTLNAGAAFSGGDNGSLNIHGNLTVDADFDDEAGVAATVYGTTEVAANTVYTVAGTANNYQGAMTLAGSLAYDSASNGVITMGRYVDGNPSSMGSVVVAGGDIAVVSGDFAVENADILITQANLGGNTIDVAVGSTLDLRSSDLTIKLDAPTATNNVVAIAPGHGITLRDYAQLAGNAVVDNSLAAGLLVVEGTAVVGSAGAEAEVSLDVAGDAAVFSRGLTLDAYGALTALNAVTGKVTLGTAANAAGLVMNGNNKLHAATGSTLMIASGHADGARMIVGGKSNVAYGEIDASAFVASIRANSQLTVATDGNPASAAMGLKASAMNVAGDLLLGTKNYAGNAVRSGVVSVAGGFTVANGGRVVADHSAAWINGNVGNVFGEEKFVVARGGKLVADTAAINAGGFSSLDINGIFTAGVLDGQSAAARLRADSDVVIGAAGVIALTSQLAAAAVAHEDAAVATHLIETDIGKVISSKAPLSNQSMLGNFNFGLNDTQTVLYVKSASGQVVLDGSAADRQQAMYNLRRMWGEGQVDAAMSAIIYDAVKGDIVSDGSLSGDKNVSLFDAIANPVGATVSHGTVEYVNGAHLYGVTDVAIETGRAFMSDMGSRSRVVNNQFAAMREAAGSSDALASAAMNAEFNNRVWFGGTGMWQDADRKDDFSGYSYDGYGIVGGYDRVVAPGLAVGAAFAYLKGDYEDKGALASDSDIESFSAGLYGTWSGCNGFFGTLFGAYTYSSNNIRELRSDPYADRSAWAVSDFHTGTWSLGGLTGYDFHLGENLVVTPSAGIRYISAQNSDHDSLLDGVATQRVKKAKNHGVFLPVELSVRYDMCVGTEGRLRFEGSAGYAYNLSKDGVKGSIDYYGLAPASGMDIRSRENAKHNYTLGAGVRYSMGSFDVGANYDYSGGSGYKTHRAMGTIGLAF